MSVSPNWPRRSFHQGNARASRPWADRRDRISFFTLWTLKEAYVKARGVSLSLPVKKLELDLEVSPPIAHFGDEIDDDASRWAFRSLRLTDRHIVGIAAAMPDGELEIVPRRTRAINPSLHV
ncbi:4'-phosphopantetheinyl transferase family protein [Mesorhizobium sp. 113-1-2]|uniref:4'-phosphopantetheinyl transferase family protein n=1 Tax=Mesorhizobium sp. 113-1-2 TaxID=2744515 RepID=UPI001FD49288|nr:4'-phosphopantetheinyl transferase superfamily protein [Mesorhizobium sp. 113-1-2]